MRRLSLLAIVLSTCSGRPEAEPSPALVSPAKQEPKSGAEVTDKPTPPAKPPSAPQIGPLPGENHLGALRQLTFGGENAEAYLSFDEEHLVYQSTRDGWPCDQIFRIPLSGGKNTLVSTGRGRTTCAYFLPGDQDIIYSSTHAADDGCLPDPDRSHGYVWKLYPEFDIYVTGPDKKQPKSLISGPGYDAEATVSPTGDLIVFTSMRDGDPEIYTAAVDGTDITRLTHTRGYDGGPFFSRDGRKIVYRANHPEGKEELATYDEIVKQNLVRPTRLELFVMNADGSNQTQVTRNGAANFGPFFHPDGDRIIFASNINDPRGRNFELYLVNVDGSGRQQVTHNESFDGFPVFTSDGKTLIFASNRGGKQRGDTNVFVAEWKD